MKRKKLGLFSIKEAFDNLPCGVAFFNPKGLPVLCNKRMQELSFEIYGKDLQSVFELEEGIESLSVKGQKDVFAVGNGVYRYERKQSRGEDGERTQIVIFDVTDLKEKQNQLLQRKKELQEIKAHLRELSKKIYDIVREEETLALKIKLHDDLGKGILLAKKTLDENASAQEIRNGCACLEKTVQTLRYVNETDENPLDIEEIVHSAKQIGLTVHMRGKNVLKKWQLPIVVNALRACISNCVRHADAQNLYAYVTQETAETKIVFTNDGKVPTSPITEGGGLSSLRRSIENKGGVMTVHSAPKFILEIRLPHNENNRMKNI